MSSTLTGNQIKNTYQALLKIGTNGSLNPTTATVISDGLGNDTQLYLSGQAVGIGTASPSYKLVVSNNGATGLEIDPDSGTPGKIGIYAVNRATSQYKAILFESLSYQFTIGNLLIGTTTDAGYKLDVNGLIRTNRTSNTDGGVVFGTAGTYLYGADSGGYLATYTTNLERMRVTSAGNVGIGTTAPASKLHINNASTTATNFLAGNINGGTFFGWDSDNTGLIANYTTNPIKFGNNYASSFVETMRITSAGNVGIGTSSPFSVSGLTLKETSSLFFALSLENRNSTQRWDIAVDINAVDDKILGILDGTSSTTRLAITDTGYVGIGTTIIDPSAQLQVVSPNVNTGFLCPQLTNAQILAISSPAEGLMVYNTDISHICFYQGGVWVKISHSPM